jgi:integrase
VRRDRRERPRRGGRELDNRERGRRYAPGLPYELSDQSAGQWDGAGAPGGRPKRRARCGERRTRRRRRRLDPDAGRVLFGNYATDWIEERPGLRPKTTELYRYLLRRHLSPTFDARPLAEIREPHVRRWRKGLLDAKVSVVTVAKAYRLLKAILNTAVDDGLIRRNPCRIKGAGQEKSAERPVLTVPEVYALADAADERYRVLVLLAAFSSLRWGELAALRRSDIDIQARTVRVTRQLNERDGGGFTFGPPKSEAGQRIVAIPELVTPDLAAHIMTHARPGNDGLVFTSPGGGPLRHTNFRRRFWVPALAAAGLPAMHFHD